MNESGYITEIAYPDYCHPLMAPVWLNYVAARNGHAPRPLAPGFTYLDLGCGLGLTATTLAACYPQGHFIGIDLNPDHIGPAKARALKAGIDNLDLIEGDFAALPDAAVPMLDFAVLHGFYTWVGPEVRRLAVDFLARKVKPGGLVLASYNALPGWASIAPLRELMRAYAADIQGTPLEKAEAARRWLDGLARSNAAFLRDHPQALREIEAMQGQRLDYLVHEYFHRDWGLFYVTDVARDFARAGLTFAGSLPSGTNEPTLSLPAELQGAAETTSRLGLELLKDFANNERLRIDVFVRSDEPGLQGPLRASLYGELVFGTALPTPDPEVDVATSGRVVRLDHRAGTARVLFDALTARPLDFTELRRAPGAPKSSTEVCKTLDSLLDGGQFRPFAATAAALAPAPENVLLPSAFNRMILFGDGKLGDTVLASPVAGDGIAIDAFAAIALRAYAKGGRAGAVALAQGEVEETRLVLFHGDDTVSGPAAADAVRTEMARFLEIYVPRLVQLGILAPA